MRRVDTGAGLEGAPDIMLLTMAALMVAIVWLASQVHEQTLPPIDLPQAEATELGRSDASALAVTVKPGEDGTTWVYLEEERVPGGTKGLAAAIAAHVERTGAAAVTLRADAETRWQDALEAMGAVARLGLAVSVAVEP